MKNKIIFFGIFLLAIFFRFNNLNWDSNHHLHPDERFLTMVGVAEKVPANLLDYFNPGTSTLNPANVGYKFFVYGTFPLTLNKIVAILSGNDNYDAFTIQGRFLSAVFDLLTLILVYKIAKLLFTKVSSLRKQATVSLRGRSIQIDSRLRGNDKNECRNDNVALWAGFLYAIAVFPIQLSHFFAVDTFLTFFMLGSFYFALKYNVILARPKAASRIVVLFYLCLSAVFFGLALACKISAIYILPLNLLLIIIGVTTVSRSYKSGNKFLSGAVILLLYFLTIYFSLRIFNPYLFQNTNFFNPFPSENFVKNIKELTVLSSGQIAYPPAIQWYSKKAHFLLVNTAVFGMGIPYFILMVIGIIKVLISNIQYLISNKISNIKNKKRIQLTINSYQLAIVLFWVLGLFSYQSLQFAKSMRYTIYLYPFFAILAGIGINSLLNSNFKAQMSNQVQSSKFKSFKHLNFGFDLNLWILPFGFIIILLLWPLMFSSIYFHKHSRVEASEWIYKNLPTNSIILSEHWDDGLPLSVEKNYGKVFRFEQLPVFDPDTPEKWQKMNELLTKADYYILSSNRGWGSIPTLPEKYPKTSKFYSDLLSNKTNYKLVKEFVSYPSLCFMFHASCFMFDDQWSEELFTVYDHPKVMVFQRKR